MVAEIALLLHCQNDNNIFYSHKYDNSYEDNAKDMEENVSDDTCPIR